MPSPGQLAGLAEASRRIHSAASIQDIVDTIVEQGRALIPAHQCVASLRPHGAPRVWAVSLSEKYADWREYDEPLRGEGIYTLPVRENCSLRMTQAELQQHSAWRGFGASEGRHPPMRGWLVAPLVTQRGENLGLVQLSDRYEGDFTAEDEVILAQVADMAALAVENARHLAAAQSAEERLRRFLDSSLDLVCTITGDGLFHEVSVNAIQILGYTPGELIGRSYRDFVISEDLAETIAEEKLVLEGRASRSFLNRYRRADGGVAHLHWSSVWSATDRLFYCVVRDLTEQVTMEARLSRAERLETVGQLTGGIAHDFNNLLTVILGSTEALVDALGGSPELLELAELARGAGERGAELTSRLLAFARRQPLQPRLVNVAELISSLETLIRRSIGDHIDTRILFADEPLFCVVDPTQLETALLNLCINARDAMPKGGTLVVRTAELDLDTAFRSRTDDLAPGRYVMIAVSDTGVGMSQQTRERAFEPFFTTKPVGEGTGLGLSMVYGFLRQSGGTAKIYSEADNGTTVKLFLPRSDSVQAGETRSHEDTPRGEARILVVEDDPLLRGQVFRQLTSLGYRVKAVENGRIALDALGRDSSFDLLFTDVVMPGGISGRQLADRALDIAPHIRVLLTSGYTEEALKASDGETIYPLLSKPYRKGDLARRIKDALAPAPPETA